MSLLKQEPSAQRPWTKTMLGWRRFAIILLLSFNWKRTVSRVPQARRSEGHGTSWHRTARLRRPWTYIFGNYAHSRRPWRGSTDRQPEGPCTPSDLSPPAPSKEVALFVHGDANTF